MGSKINLINTSGKRLPKKPGLNQTNLTSDGQSLAIQSPTFDGNVGGGGGISLPIPNKLNNNTNEPLVLNLRAIGAGVFVDNTTVTIINNCVFENTSLTNIELNALSTVGGGNNITGNSALTEISLPLLSTVGDYSNYIQYKDALTEISLPLLSTVGGGNYIENNDALTEISLPLLSTVGGDNYIGNNPALTSIIISSTGFTAGGDYYFDNNALSEQTVDNILIAFDNSGIENKTIYLDGGTNSVPSAAGLTAKSNLEGKGWTVNVNS